MECLNCGTETSNPKFCSRSCSASYNNRGTCRNGERPSDCLCCGKKVRLSTQKFCSHRCQWEYSYQQYIERWLLGEETGYVGNGEQISQRVKRWLLEKHGNKCELCGWGEENPITKNIPLQVHHIDGNCLDCSLKNLQLLCPNCHSLTETFGGCNKGRSGRIKRYASKA
jgi:hypothetical protein